MKILIFILLVLIFIINYHETKQNLIETINNLKNNIDYLSILDDMYNHNFKDRFLNKKINNKLDKVDMIYCIAMPQRRDYITDKMNKLNVNYKIFDAVKPDDLSEDDYSNLSVINVPGSKIYKKYTR